MNLLSVDWDFFFRPNPNGDEPGLYDWGSRESELHIFGPLWLIRANAFVANGLELPGTTGDEKKFWNRIQLAEHAICYYGESHLLATRPVVRQGITQLWNYDAHHDMGYNREDWLHETTHCGNWVLDYKDQLMRYHWRKPKWVRNNAAKMPIDKIRFPRVTLQNASAMEYRDVIFDRVFICRSGAWVPPWLDHDYAAFVRACPAELKISLNPDFRFDPPREFDISQLEALSQLNPKRR